MSCYLEFGFVLGFEDIEKRGGEGLGGRGGYEVRIFGMVSFILEG